MLVSLMIYNFLEGAALYTLSDSMEIYSLKPLLFW